MEENVCKRKQHDLEKPRVSKKSISFLNPWAYGVGHPGSFITFLFRWVS